MKKAIIVSFEGIDGCGKTTHVKKFYEYLIKKGINAIILHEPGGTKTGERIRKILLDRNEKIGNWCELFLYLASRAQLVEEKIKKYLQKNCVIILDRYIDSTFAYQGYGREIPLNLIKKIHDSFLNKNYLPDITFLIDADPITLIQIMKKKKKDRIEKENLEFQKRVREGYLEIAKQTKRIKVIERNDIEKTFQNIIEEWEKFINEIRTGKRNIKKSKRKK